MDLQRSDIFDRQSLERLLKGSWIDSKTYSAITLPTKILGHISFNANPHF
jgi:hypothetical protein